MVECTDEKIGILISDYFSGHLNAAEAELVTGHLAVCQLCRESLQTMTMLAPDGSAGRLSHPSKSVLAQYHQGRQQLDPVMSTLLEQHLAKCRDCAAELTILDDMERELRASLTGREQDGGRIQSLVGRFGRYVAYAAAACLLLTVGYRVLVTEDRERDQSRVYQLSESTRSSGEIVEIRQDANAKSVVLEVTFYHARAENDYSATLTDAEGAPADAKVVRLSFPSPDQILVQAQISDLQPGEYQLVITESRRDRSAPPSQTFFPFRVVRGN